jgi:hypothetical protein
LRNWKVTSKHSRQVRSKERKKEKLPARSYSKNR